MVNRVDLTKWVIHFIHDKDPEMDIYNDEGKIVEYPIGWDDNGIPIFNQWTYLDDGFPIEPDASAFAVLKKILFDGYLKAGWVIRNYRPAVFGPKPVVCFTEMPLHAFLSYVKNRNNPNFVNNYGIALLKDEFFNIGGRPVIYGLSSLFKEYKKDDPLRDNGLRVLHSSCGIGLNEQYRFVPMELDKPKFIDWSHEREWRWAYDHKKYELPGLPIWLQNEDIKFSKIIVIVKNKEEANDIVDKLKEFYDSGGNNWDFRFNKAILSNTLVLPIEEISVEEHLEKPQDWNVKLESLPFKKLTKISPILPTTKSFKLVKKAMIEARKVAMDAAERCKEILPKDKIGRYLSPFGYSHVITFDSHSEITEAMLKLKYAKAIGGIGYFVYEPTQNVNSEGMLDIAVAASEAAAKKLTELLGQDFFVYSDLN